MKYAYTQFLDVKINGDTYSYLWEGNEEIQKGDWVEVPPNYKNPSPQTVQVVSTESDYIGRITNVTKKVVCTCTDPGSPICVYHPSQSKKQTLEDLLNEPASWDPF